MPTRKTRNTRGLEQLSSELPTAQPVVALLDLNGVPRAGVSVQEFAAIFGVAEWTVARLVREGEIATLPRFGAAHHVIPVSEIARWQHDQTQ